ncbi:QueT transporter family protein [Ruminococcus sp.]|uniref:QueT transporter family protein n=1 Tax=Ruminococcus sp. TaxID=41978 RepID=UPI0025E9D3AB|nr:QueT transporter family protein [Ruminococcus sp.]MBQ8966998.1 QueT transporter family protein [Ruminococcus sp.]
MEMFNSRRITNIGVMTAVYVAATILCSPLAYGDVQFRVSEMLMLLCYFNKDYIISMTLGCFIVNLWSPLGFIDVGCGTVATVIAAVLIYALRNKTNLFVVSLFPVLTNGLIVAAELKYVYGLPYWLSAGSVALGEFVCVSILGVIIVNALRKNKGFMKLITAGNENARKEVRS